MRLQSRAYEILEPAAEGDRASRAFNIFILALIALPTGILGAAFVEELEKRKRGREVCPHCGKELTE